MSWTLYLDDDRRCPYPDAEVARSVADAIALIEARGLPAFLSFDYDMVGQGLTGHYLALWIEEKVGAGDLVLPSGFTYDVHSSNPGGARAIAAVMRRVTGAAPLHGKPHPKP